MIRPFCIKKFSWPVYRSILKISFYYKCFLLCFSRLLLPILARSHSFETMRKLCLSKKLPHQWITWNYSILRSAHLFHGLEGQEGLSWQLITKLFGAFLVVLLTTWNCITTHITRNHCCHFLSRLLHPRATVFPQIWWLLIYLAIYI